VVVMLGNRIANFLIGYQNRTHVRGTKLTRCSEVSGVVSRGEVV
jgi:hypothetical protein